MTPPPQQKTALQSLRGKTFEHYDKVKEITGDSTATGRLAHRGTRSMLSPPSRPDQDEQEDPQSLGNMIAGITGQSQSGLANVMSTNTTFCELLSTSAFTDSLASDISGLPSSILTPGPLLPPVATSVTHHAPPLSARNPQSAAAPSRLPSPAHSETFPPPHQLTSSASTMDVNPNLTPLSSRETPSASPSLHPSASGQTGTSASSGKHKR
jgi:hypothetical protein